ncbi:hypothetical protein V6N13_030798 [Hibiscus sabdariffa]
MVRNRPFSSSSPPPQLFIDDAAQERFQTLKNRSVFFKQGFVFKDEDLGPDVMDVVSQHKWEKFTKHPGDVNATIVKEFYANIAEPKQNSVLLLTITQRSKRKQIMKPTMTLWKIYALQIPNGMGNKQAGGR